MTSISYNAQIVLGSLTIVAAVIFVLLVAWYYSPEQQAYRRAVEYSNNPAKFFEDAGNLDGP